MAAKSQVGVRAIVVSGHGLVMVEHEEKGKRFSVFPGGGLEEGETIFEGVVREVKEETNLEVVAENVAYIREIVAGEAHGVEFYVVCKILAGEMELGRDPEHEDGNKILKAVRTVPVEELAVTDNWYPSEVRGRIASDFKDGFPETVFLGTARL